LMQFYLLGDPSAQPVAATAHSLTRTKAFRKAFGGGQDRTVRNLRRERLEREGRNLGKSLPALRPSETGPADKVAAVLEALRRESGLRDDLVRLSFEVQARASSPTKDHVRRVHVIKGRRTMVEAEQRVVRIVAVVATEEEGNLLHVRRLHSR